MAKKIINVVYQVDDKALLKAKTEIQGIEKETKDSEKEMLKLDKAIQQTGNNGAGSFLNFKNLLGGAVATTIIALGKHIFDLGVKQEQLNIAFTTFLGSASKAKILLAELTKFSIITPFTPEQVNSAAKSLLAFGIQAKEIVPTLKMLGDVSAGTGKDLTEMAIIFGQIRSTGRLMGQDLLQLINAGFNPLQIISEKTGKSVAQLKQEMEKGAISFQMVSDAFKTATSEGGLFFNLMEKQSQSIGGKLSTVAGNIEEVFKNIFSASSGPLSDFVDKLGKISEAFLLMSKSAEQLANEGAEVGLERFRKKLSEIEDQLKTNNKSLQKTAIEAQNLFAQDVVTAINEVSTELEELNKDFQMDTKELQFRKAVLEAEKKGLEGIKDELFKLTVGTKENTTETKKSNQELKDRAKALEAINKQLGFQTAAQKVTQADKEAKDQEKREKENNDRSNENADRQYKYQQEKLKQAKDEEFRILEEDAQRKRDLEQQLTDFAINSLEQVLYATLLGREEDFTSQQEQFDREMMLAGDNERAKDQIRIRQEQAEKNFRIRQKEEERRAALKKIAIDTAINIIRSIANNGGIPYGLPAGALALAAGLVQAATVRKLAKGEVLIDGPGTTTSDSIPAMLSKNESVINAKASQASPNLLNAINDRKIDDRILHKMAANGGSQVVVNDNRDVIKAIQDNAVDYEKHGYTLMKVKGARTNFRQYMRSKTHG